MDIKVADNILMVDYLDVASTLWDSLVNDTFVKKEKILPLQNTEADKIKARISSFNTRLTEFYKSFRASNLFTYNELYVKFFFLVLMTFLSLSLSITHKHTQILGTVT